MFRSKAASVYLLAPVLVAAGLLSGACSTPPEETLVNQFFRASSIRDNQTLANFAVVEFSPQKDGTVTSLNVVSVSPERAEPLQVIALVKALADAEAAEKEFNSRKKAYQDEHIDAILRVLKAEGSKQKPARADETVQTEWAKWREDTAAEAKKLAAAKAQLSAARLVPEVSLTKANGILPEDSEMDGNLVSKDVTVDATVKAPDGSTSQKPLVVTIQRAVVKGAEGAQGDRTGKWIITAVKPA